MRMWIPIMAGAVAFSGTTAANAGEPTCSHFGTATHGEHIIGDYVTGLGGAFPPDSLSWPPKGGEVGAAVSENRGPVIRGGPGPGFHFENGIAAGASSCLDAQSPGIHFPPPD